jgi:hypothetical protein
LQNGQSAQDFLEENQNANIQTCATPFPTGGDIACQTIDPTLTVIRAEPSPSDPTAEPIAVMAFYAVHPTVMGSATEVYSSLANVLMDESRGIPPPYHPFLVFIDTNPK